MWHKLSSAWHTPSLTSRGEYQCMQSQYTHLLYPIAGHYGGKACWAWYQRCVEDPGCHIGRTQAAAGQGHCGDAESLERVSDSPRHALVLSAGAAEEAEHLCWYLQPLFFPVSLVFTPWAPIHLPAERERERESVFWFPISRLAFFLFLDVYILSMIVYAMKPHADPMSALSYACTNPKLHSSLVLSIRVMQSPLWGLIHRLLHLRIHLFHHI